MCGTIAFALPVHHRSSAGRVVGIGIYNVGRLLTYGALGAVFGLLGKGFVLGGFQQWVSMVLGSVMVLSVLLPAVFRNRLNPNGAITRSLAWVQGHLRAALGRTSNPAMFSIGLLNGLLPCGLVYLAVAGAIASGAPETGALYMLLFGIGTLPMMFVVSYARQLIGPKLRASIQKAMPVVVLVLGLLFIVRGMDLGIPYISPEMAEECAAASCCHPE